MTSIIGWIIVSFFSTYSFLDLYYNLCDAKRVISRKIIVMFLLGFLCQAYIQLNESTILSVLSYFLYFPTFFYIIKPLSLKKLIFYVLTIWLFAMAIDITALLVFSTIFNFINVDFAWYVENSVYVSMLFTIFVTIMLMFIGRKKFLNSIVDKLYSKFDNIKFLDFLLVIFSIFILTFTVLMLINVESLNINILFSIIIVLMIVTFILLLRFKINENENIKYLNTIRENNDFYIKMEDENRIFKHNLIAKLSSIKSVSNKKSILLIDDLIKQFNKSIDFSKSMKIIPYGLNGIIYEKLYPHMKDLNIKINNNIKYDVFKVLKPRRYNVLIEKLMLGLDNAIEASLKSKEKLLVIDISDSDDAISIELRNTFSGTINMDLLGDKNYSTKDKKSGLGLFSMIRNTEASVKLKIVNKYFITEISAKKRLNN